MFHLSVAALVVYLHGATHLYSYTVIEKLKTVDKSKNSRKNEQVGESKFLLSIGETCKSLPKYG